MVPHPTNTWLFVIELHNVPRRFLAFVFDSLSPLCRPTLLLEKYQPWLDLKIPSKVDASLSEVVYTHINTSTEQVIKGSIIVITMLFSEDFGAGSGEFCVSLVQVSMLSCVCI